MNKNPNTKENLSIKTTNMNIKRIQKKYLIIIFVLITLIVVTLIAFFWIDQQQYSIPDTPAGNRLTELISVINSGNYTSINSYIMENFTDGFIGKSSINSHTDSLMNIHFTSHNLEFIKWTSSSSYRILGIFNNQLMDNYINFGLEVETQPPYRIDVTFLGPSEYIDHKSSLQEMSEAQVVATFESLIDNLSDSDVFSGTVLIGKNDNIIFQKAYGFANKDTLIFNENDTRFNIGSVGKMFTAVAIAQLAENGSLSYEDNIGMYLGSDWVNDEIGEKVKIKHLLTHTSGLGDYMENQQYMDINETPASLENYKPFLINEYLQFVPGTQWSYSNTGFLLLGVIIENVTGLSYDQYMDLNIFKPSNMTGVLNVETQVQGFPAPDFAIGYSREYSINGAIWNDNLDLISKTTKNPAGGGFLNVEDLFNFSVALKNNKLITEETKNIVMSEKPMLNSPFYGYGFEVKENNNEIIVGHGGSHSGISAIIEMSLDNEYTLIMLSNHGHIVFIVFPIRDKFWDLVL
jgi:CubicO group peptidase (beta-lactamase class C family)